MQHPTVDNVKAIDAELAALNLVAVGLKRRRNSLAAISILSPEILSEIFLNVAHYPLMRGWRVSGGPSIIPILFKLCRVCHTWRQVALRTPALWSLIQVLDSDRPMGSSQSLLRHMLDHAKAVPLTLLLASNNVWETLVPTDVIPRIRRLHLATDAACVGITKEIVPLFNTNLQDLALNRWNPAWKGLHAPNLTRLCISSLVELSLTVIKDLLLVLRHCSKNLRFLFLDFSTYDNQNGRATPDSALDEGTSGPTPMPVVTYLPRLQDLTLLAGSAIRAAVIFLSNIRLPTSTIENVTINESDTTGSGNPELRSQQLKAMCHALRTALGTRYPPEVLEMSRSIVLLSRHLPGSGMKQTLRIVPTVYGPSDPDAQVMITNPTVLSLVASLEDLKAVRVSKTTDMAMWSAIASLPKLERIDLDDEDGWRHFHGFIHSRISESSPFEIPTSPFFPALQEIRVMETTQILASIQPRGTLDQVVGALAQRLEDLKRFTRRAACWRLRRVVFGGIGELDLIFPPSRDACRALRCVAEDVQGIAGGALKQSDLEELFGFKFEPYYAAYRNSPPHGVSSRKLGASVNSTNGSTHPRRIKFHSAAVPDQLQVGTSRFSFTTDIQPNPLPNHTTWTGSMGESPKLEIASIDDELASLAARTLELNRRRNALIPISSLPAEILSKIMLDCLGFGIWPWTTQPIEIRRGRGRPRDCVRLSHVSTTWRSVALGTPNIWTRICVNNRTKKELVRLMLDRAKEAPFVLESNVGQLHDGVLTKATVEQVVVLVLSMNTSAEYLGHVARTELGVGLRDLAFPNLRELYIEVARIPWEAQLFRSPHLTHLTVHNSVDSIPEAILNLVGSLRCCRQLRFLKLSLETFQRSAASSEQRDGEESNEQEDSPGIVALRYLEELHLRFSSVTAVSMLLSRLRLPSTTHTVALKHRPKVLYERMASFAPLLSALGKAFQGEHALSPDTLDFPDDRTLIASTAPSSARTPSSLAFASSINPTHSQRILISSSTTDIIALADQITLAMSLDRIKTFSATHGTPPAIWASLKTLPNLERIDVSAGGWKGFVEWCYDEGAVGASSSSSARVVYARGVGRHYDSPAPGPRILPGLREVRVFDTSQILDEHYRRATMGVSVDAMVGALIKVLRARVWSGSSGGVRQGFPSVRFERVWDYRKHLKEGTRKTIMEVAEGVEWV